MTTRTTNHESFAAWTVAEPQLVRRRVALRTAVDSCRRSVECEEHIHKLRVASRRLEAALTSYGLLLPEKLCRRVRKQVRRLRRHAGRVRDLDVLMLRLQEDSAAGSVIPVLQQQRRHLADDLITQLSDRRQNRLRRDLKRLIRQREFEVEPDVQTWAAEQMQPPADRFLDAASGELRRIKDLHRLRLCGKRLRYSLELFREHLDPVEATRLLKLLRGLQERLGDMNDHASARVLLNDIVDSSSDRAVSDAAARLARREKKLLKRSRRTFLDWWREGAFREVADSVRKTVWEATDVSATP